VIYSFDRLPSTQTWLEERVKEGEVALPCAVLARSQSDGIGSRGHRWIGRPGNFFASVALQRDRLPEDLPLNAVSIYMAMTMKLTLAEMGSGVWVKWPNDFYVNDRKAGGCITSLKKDTIISGIGLNLADAPENFAVLDISTTPEEVLERFLIELEKKSTWKQIFSIFSLEFDRSKKFSAHDGDEKVHLGEAVLQADGSLMIGNKRVTSLR